MFKEFPDDDAKVDDFLNEFRQKISDNNIESLEEKKEDLKRSRSIFIGIAGGVSLAGIVGWLILAPQYRIESSKEIPVIRRPQTAIKIQPNEPGGMEIPNQDKSVYNIIEKKDNNNIENLLPPPEAPKLPTVVTQQDNSEPTTIATNTLPEAEKIIQKAENAKTPSAEAINATEQQVVAQIKQAEETEILKSQQVALQDNAPAPKQTIKKETQVSTSQPQPVKKTTKVTNTSAIVGDWQIQLMSSPNKPAVEKAKTDLGKKYKISHLPFEIESAILDMNKTFYRLKVGAFKNRADADKLCNDIKALGGTCIVKKK